MKIVVLASRGGIHECICRQSTTDYVVVSAVLLYIAWRVLIGSEYGR